MTDVIEAPRLTESHAHPETQVRASRALLEATVAGLWASAADLRLAREVLGRYPEHRRQIEEAAVLIDADPLDLTLANLSYDLNVRGHGCSTAALAGPDGPVVVRNLDWPNTDLLARAGCVLPTDHGTQAGFVGGVGVVTGLSHHGFALALNAAWCGRSDPGGYPVLLLLRHLLDHARTFGEAVEMAATTPLMSGCLITLAGRRNGERAVVERTPSSAAIRTPRGDEPLVTTNHYREMARPEGCNRHACLTADTLALPSGPNDEHLLACLTREPVLNGGTAHHVLMRPAAGSLRLFVPRRLLG